MIRAKVEGDVLIDGISVLTEDSLRPAAGVGLVQQDPDAQICTLSVWEEVAFGPENLCLPPEEVTARVDGVARLPRHLPPRGTGDDPPLGWGEAAGRDRLDPGAAAAGDPAR